MSEKSERPREISSHRAPEAADAPSTEPHDRRFGDSLGSAFLSASEANDQVQEHLRDMRWFVRSRAHAEEAGFDGPRFGLLSDLSERARAIAFDHPEIERLGEAFTDGRDVFISAPAALRELSRDPAGDPLMTLYLRALAFIGRLDYDALPEIHRNIEKLAEPKASVAFVEPRRLAAALERSNLGELAALLYPPGARLGFPERLEPAPLGSLPRFSAAISRAAQAFDQAARAPKP